MSIDCCSSCKYDDLAKRETVLKLSENNAKSLIPSYCRLMKLAAGRLKWKWESYIEKRKKRPHGEIALKDQDIRALHILCGILDQHLTDVCITPCSSGLGEGFNLKNADEALAYFERNLENKKCKDSFGDEILISDESYIFMYKDTEERHTFEPQNYVKERGQRLPYILHVISQSKCIFERPYRYDRNNMIDRMYLCAINEHWKEDSKIFFCVIVLKSKNPDIPTKFKTAFPLASENDLCRRISGGYQYVSKK